MPRPSGPSLSLGRSQRRLYFFPSVPFFFGGGGPNGEIGDVIDDSSEGLPVSVVEHGLVDGRETSLITVFAHLVRLSVNLGSQCLLLSVVKTEGSKARL